MDVHATDYSLEYNSLKHLFMEAGDGSCLFKLVDKAVFENL